MFFCFTNIGLVLIIIINDYDYYAKLDDIILNTKEITELTINDGKIHPMISKENSIV